MKRELLIFRDGKRTRTPLIEPLGEGEQGNMQTLRAMAKIVNEDRSQPDLRIFVLREIIGNVRGHDAAGEVKRIFEFARDRITYRRDPYNVERVSDIWSTMYALNPNEPEGDCGIKSLFIASCCAILGHKPFFTVIKQRTGQKAFNHVYNMVLIGGQVTYLDATPEDRPIGWEAPSVEKMVFPVFD